MNDISPHYVRVALRSAERHGLDIEALCRHCDIDRDALAGPQRVSAEQFCRLWQYLWDELDDEFLGFSKHPSKRGTFALACKLACQAANFKQMFREIQRIYQLVDSDLWVELQAVDDDCVALRLQHRHPEYDIEHFIGEYFLFYWHRLACWVGGSKLKPLRAEFSYPEPPHAELYRELFPCPLRFDAEHTALIFGDSFLQQQPLRSRKELYEFLNRLPADFMSLPGRDTSLVTRIKLLILDNSREQLRFPPLEQLAEQLHMSRSSLGRKLASEHYSYRQLKEAIRQDLVIEKLQLTDMSVGDIALLAGFSESTSLNRAFKQWTGMTPQQFRGQKPESANSG